MAWTDAAGILCFVSGARDRPWQGSPDALEPDKHRGPFTVERQPQPVMADWPAAVPARARSSGSGGVRAGGQRGVATTPQY